MNHQIYLTFILIILISCIETSTQLCFKFVTAKIDSLHISVKNMFKLAWVMITYPMTWFGFILAVTNIVIWLFLLSFTDLNFAFSLSSIQYIFIVFASQQILKENVGPLRWIATFSIALGVLIVGLTGGME